ncbi:hypothetical protein ACIBM4_00830 [Streptomyces sp. NPDC050256]|uniref:hypothetical protein n=1 Tax=unclassified Streptomyces TaxID=2593676 RepID=UPI00378D85F1
MSRTVMYAVVMPVAVVSSLASCVLTNGPVTMHFGFRMEGDALVVAYPICPSESVYGAKIVVSVGGAGDGDGFETKWSANGPRSGEVRRGLFVAGSDVSFAKETKPLAGRLPDGFYVGLQLGTPGHPVEGNDDWVDLPALRSAKLADDQYWVYRNKPMTRAQINAQRSCPTKTG